MTASWSDPTSDDEAARRAAGRHHYNTTRKLNAELRRAAEVDWLLVHGGGRGTVASLAKQFGISPSTASRDLREIRANTLEICDSCGNVTGLGLDWLIDDDESA